MWKSADTADIGTNQMQRSLVTALYKSSLKKLSSLNRVCLVNKLNAGSFVKIGVSTITE